MTEHFAVLILTTIANLTLGLAVWLRNSSQRINQYFGIFAIAVAAWTLSNGLVSVYAGTPWGIIWARTAFASASLIPLSFFLFTRVFPSPKPVPPKAVSYAWVGIGLIAFFLSFTSAIARSTRSINGVLHVTYGPFHPLFGAYFLSCAGYSFLLLARKLPVLKGIEKLQVRYVFLGASLMALGATITNLIIPLVFHSSRFSPYGPLFTFVMIALIAHSIIRYRLLNIRLVVSRSITYLLAVATVGWVFVFLAWLVSRLFGSRPQELPLWMELALVLLIALLFQPVKRWVQISLDRYFFRESYDYQRTLREISRTMGGILDLQSLLQYVCGAIGKTVRPESVKVYTEDVTGQTFRCLAARREIEVGGIPENEVVPASSPFIALLLKEKKHILGDQLKGIHDDPQTLVALQALRNLGGELTLPIIEEGRLTGFFLLGPKLSGDPYFAEDIDLLTTLVTQAAIAIKNAQLYGQVLLVNEYIENILGTIESGVVAAAADGAVSLFNASAERMTRLNAQNVKGCPVRNLPAGIAAPLEATLKDGEPRTQLETIIKDNLGRLTPVMCSTSTLKDRSGTILGAVAVFSDLTRLKELEGEKRRAERLAAIGGLASGIAHEIKNPLVAIRTFAELLPERFSEEDFHGEFSRVVIKEIERIDNLVARLRGLATQPTQQLLPLDVRGPIEETLALLRGQLEQKRIIIRRLYEADLPLIRGDSAQLKQLFLNLFINALDAMERGGELSIHLESRDVSGRRTIVAEISDTGTGIPDALLGTIFEAFVTTKPGGSGLGLSICRGIADGHRATIRIHNNPNGKGATAVIEFPVVHDLRIPVYNR